MRTLAAFILFVVLLLVGCRNESERTAMARTAAAPGAGGAAWDPGADAPGVRLRRLWTGSDFNFYASSPSPDGRYVTEIDWSTGDLAVRDLSTGRLHRLTDKGSWDDSGAYAETSTFSRDGTRVVYVWFMPETDTHEVRIVDFNPDAAGVPQISDPQIALADSPLLVTAMHGWTSDDQLLTGISRPGNTTALGLLSLSTGDLQVLKSFDWREAHAAPSRDGRFIAYDHPPGTDPRDREIHLISLDGGLETTLVEGAGRDVVLGWAPDDAFLLFYSERSGTPSVWRLPMADGQPTGPAELVREDVQRLEPMGFAGDNYYFGVMVERPAYSTAVVDYKASRLVPMSTVFDAPDGRTFPVKTLAWSPDGAHVVHDVSAPEGTWIYLRSADGTVIREWKFDFVIRANPASARWTPGGQSVLLGAIDGQGRAGLFRIDLESGELEMVRRFEAQGYFQLPFSFSADGRTVYFTDVAAENGAQAAVGPPEERAFEVVALDLESGTERSIHPVGFRGPVVPSPDGAMLAYHGFGTETDRTIQLIPAEGGEPQVLHRVEAPARPWGIVGWSPDGEFLLFLRINETDGIQLWKVSRDGAAAEMVSALPDYAGGWDLHPDGRTLAFRRGAWRGEIWAMEGAVATITADGEVDR